MFFAHVCLNLLSAARHPSIQLEKQPSANLPLSEVSYNEVDNAGP